MDNPRLPVPMPPPASRRMRALTQMYGMPSRSLKRERPKRKPLPPARINRYRPRTGEPAFPYREIIFIIAITCCLPAFYYWGSQHPALQVKNIRVNGLEQIPESEVLRYAGIGTSMNLLTFNPFTARKRLLTHPWIADAEIRFDSIRSLHLEIREHRPLAAVDIRSRYLLNAEGKIFKKWTPSDPGSLPVVTGLKFTDIGGAAASGETPFQSVMDVLHLGAAEESILSNRIIRFIDVDRELGLTLILDQPETQVRIRRIRLGLHDYRTKYRNLRFLLNFLTNNVEIIAIDSIDLNNPDRIVVDQPKQDHPETEQMREGVNKEV